MQPAQLIRQVPWRTRDALVVFLVPWVILPILALIWLSFASSFLPGANSLLSAVINGDPRANFVLVIIDAVGSFAVIAYYLKKYQVGWRDLGLRSFSLLKAGLYIALLFGLFVASIGLIYALVQLLAPGFDANQPQVNEFTNVAPPYRIYSLLALVILPPLVEEPVFRGFLFPAFSKRFGLIGGAVISSVLFGFAHLQANVGIYTFFIGLILCFLYSRLGSIIPGMGLHMLNNYLAYMALTHPK